MNFDLTQMLTGHGCFNAYLNRIARAPSAGCTHCTQQGVENETKDDAEHTLMQYEAFEHDREKLIREIDSFGPKDLILIIT